MFAWRWVDRSGNRRTECRIARCLRRSSVWADRRAAKAIHLIEHVRLHQALSVVPIDSRARLVDGLLSPLLVDREWTTLRATLIAWGDSAFNMTRAAERLHVHRNTLIYRLDKIARALQRLSRARPGRRPVHHMRDR